MLSFPWELSDFFLNIFGNFRGIVSLADTSDDCRIRPFGLSNMLSLVWVPLDFFLDIDGRFRGIESSADKSDNWHDNTSGFCNILSRGCELSDSCLDIFAASFRGIDPSTDKFDDCCESFLGTITFVGISFDAGLFFSSIVKAACGSCASSSELSDKQRLYATESSPSPSSEHSTLPPSNRISCVIFSLFNDFKSASAGK
mmetsp:Transcript_18428/g.28704  ORF Transcript_18428/g.28704 Transcript_18428/m.28704 type:complete len:200 (-) Transcript_18428:1448-2047(-)